MKRISLLSFFLLAMTMVTRGQIAVESFRPLETDLTAATSGTQVTDQNDDVAALIKVVTTQQGFSFDNGMLGIVKVVPKPAEYWVYVPKGTLKLTVAHPELGMLRDYYFKIPIESARTYEMVLTTGEVITTVKKARTSQYLTIRVTPPNATLYIDDELQALSAEGTFFKLMPLGKHTYRVQAAGYKPAVGVVELTAKEKGEVKAELQSLQGTLTISCSDSEADIVVNEEVKGKGRWSGVLFPGMYIVEARHAGYHTTTEEVTLGELEKKSIALAPPTPILGSLRVESEPMEAAVFVDGRRYGETPCVLDESAGLLVGSHSVKLSKEGYADYTAIVTIKENEETALTGISLTKAVAGAEVKNIDGHEYADLGLPSGLLWATCNVGASNPEDFGNYYAWGETSTKSTYDWTTLKNRTSGDSYGNVKFSKYNSKNDRGTVDNKTVLDLSDDAARVNWGGGWRMPSRAEWQELKDNCTWIWTSERGHKGYRVTSKNGNSIFLPAAGCRWDSEPGYAGDSGYYWSSSLYADNPYSACCVYFYLRSVDDSYYSRYYGQSVRPVCAP